MSYRTGVLLLLLPAVAWATHIELSPRSSTDRPPNEEPGGSTITLMLPGLEACFDPADPVLARGVVGKITIRLKNDGTAKVYGSGDPLLARGPIADCIREQDSAVSIPKLQEPSTTFYVDVRILPALARPADQAVDLTVPPHFDGAPLHGEPIDVRGKRAWTPLLAVATLGSEAWDDKNTVKVQVSVRRTKNGVYKDTSDLEDALVDVVDLDGALLTTATTDVAGEVLVPVACSAGPMVWVGGRHPDSGAWLTPPQLVDLDAQPCPDLRHRNMLEEALRSRV